MLAAVRPYYGENTTVIGVHICVAICVEGWYVFNIEKRDFTTEKYILIFLYR